MLQGLFHWEINVSKPYIPGARSIEADDNREANSSALLSEIIQDNQEKASSLKAKQLRLLKLLREDSNSQPVQSPRPKVQS